MRSIPFIVLLAASAAGGWVVGRAFDKFRTGGEVAVTAALTPPKQRLSPSFAAPGTPAGSWIARVKKAGPTDFPKLLEEWKTIFPEGENYLDGRPGNALQWLFSMWLVKDAEGFLNVVTAKDFKYGYRAAQAFGRMMPGKAAELLMGAGVGEMEKYFVMGLLDELAENAPAVYLKVDPDGTFLSRLDPQAGSGYWQEAITNLAKTDPVAAGNACLRWKVENGTSTFYYVLLDVAKVWKSGDLAFAQLLNDITDPKLRNFANHARIAALAERDPRAALAELYSTQPEPNTDMNYDARFVVLNRLAKADPVGALKLLKEVEGIYSKYRRDNFDEPSAEEKAEGVANPFSHLGPGPFGSGEIEENRVRQTILNSMAEKLPDDPGQFFAAARKLMAEAGEGGGDRQRGIEAALLASKAVAWSAEECLSVASMWGEGASRKGDDPAWQALAEYAVIENPETALSGLDRLPETARSFFAVEAIKQLMESSPERVIALFDHLSPAQWDEFMGARLGRNAEAFAAAFATLPASTTSEARLGFMRQWGKDDPEAASRWLEGLPNEAASKSAAEGLAFAWVHNDEHATSAWAASLPEGPKRDAAAAVLSFQLAEGLPDDAWEWANSISDPAARDKAILDLDYRWRDEMPEKYRARLEAVRRAAEESDGEEEPQSDPNDPFR